MAEGNQPRPFNPVLNDNIEVISKTSSASHELTVPSYSFHYLYIMSTAASVNFFGFISATSSGLVSVVTINTGTGITVARGEGNNKLAITLDTSRPLYVMDVHLNGSAVS